MTAVLVTVSEVPSKEAKGGAGSFGDVVDVCVPFDVSVMRTGHQCMGQLLGTCFRISLLRL